MNKQEQFYKESVLKWMDKFGLGRWSVQFIPWPAVPEAYRDDDIASASASISVDSRYARFALNTDKAEDKSNTFIDRCALHEVAHLMIERLASMAYRNNVPEDDVEEELEAIAKSMERCFFGMVEE